MLKLFCGLKKVYTVSHQKTLVNLSFKILYANPPHSNPFNKEKCIAGKKWYYAFKKRHPNLSLRQPENISVARARGFNSETVFDVLGKVVDKNEPNALKIYNVDESGFTTVQKESNQRLSV